MKTVLVTGGSGFIGSHLCLVLLENNFRVVVLDSFVNSSYLALKRLPEIIGKKITNLKEKLFIYEGDLRDEFFLNKIFSDFTKKNISIAAVIHLAGLKAVSDSLINPDKYWDFNVKGSIKLFKTMKKYGCKDIVFSSSATVYDNSLLGLITEEAPLKPSNPYGYTKLEVERILKKNYLKNKDIWNVVILRYFNPIGAHSSGLIGEDPKKKATNLFPLLLDVAAYDKKILNIYGNDWPTSDGTCMRDFIHIMDLAEAHFAAIEYMTKKKSDFLIVNVGTGKGTTILKLIEVFERVNNCKIPYKFVERRDGDISQSIADNSLALKKLDWFNKRNIEDMCVDGWQWKKNNPNGYF